MALAGCVYIRPSSWPEPGRRRAELDSKIDICLPFSLKILYFLLHSLGLWVADLVRLIIATPVVSCSGRCRWSSPRRLQPGYPQDSIAMTKIQTLRRSGDGFGVR
ncbi:hypothetical protein OH76DRAFT_484344 [Lentinus brumalis]|uniref:Uncharacterized protein n=1 Tax=Lentinus brumalis TaxID=2498619 RepID=A0A371DC51_9APHY|nr:hypothetical protein OH76DRAFT_484344 [Polyporus brumalis]